MQKRDLAEPLRLVKAVVAYSLAQAICFLLSPRLTVQKLLIKLQILTDYGRISSCTGGCVTDFHSAMSPTSSCFPFPLHRSLQVCEYTIKSLARGGCKNTLGITYYFDHVREVHH